MNGKTTFVATVSTIRINNEMELQHELYKTSLNELNKSSKKQNIISTVLTVIL